MKTIIYVKSYVKQNNEKIIKISSLHNQNIPEIIIPDNVFHSIGFWLFNIKIIYKIGQKRFIIFLLKDIKVKLLSTFNLNFMGQFYKIYKKKDSIY